MAIETNPAYMQRKRTLQRLMFGCFRLLSYSVALLLFFIVSALYFAPQFRGEVLPQHDVQQYEGMAKEIWDNRAQTGEDPQWAGRMFGGMPAYLA